MFKSSIGLVKKICGTSGGSSAALGRPKKFPLPKNELKSLVFDKNWPGVWRNHFRMQLQLGSYTKMHFVSPKNFLGCSGGLRPHMGGSKTNHFARNSNKSEISDQNFDRLARIQRSDILDAFQDYLEVLRFHFLCCYDKKQQIRFLLIFERLK